MFMLLNVWSVLKIIHNVSSRNGSRHMKNDSTTAPNIRTTCFRALKLNSGLVGRIRIIAPSFDIRFLAIIPYKTINIINGIIKNREIVIRKNAIVHVDDACVRQTATIVPSI